MPPKWSLSPPRWHRSADQASDLKAGIDLGHSPRRTLSELGVGFSMAGDQTAGLTYIAGVVSKVGLIGMDETTTRDINLDSRHNKDFVEPILANKQTLIM